MPRTRKQRARQKQTKKRVKKPAADGSIQRIKPELFKKLNDLSPFELKNRLIKELQKFMLMMLIIKKQKTELSLILQNLIL